MSDRTYHWLFASLAAFGLIADQASKYGVFRWLRDGRYAVRSAPNTYARDVVPGWFELVAQYEPQAIPQEYGLARLQTRSAPVLPRVNHGALLGLGGSRRSDANRFFAAVSAVAAGAILLWVTRHDPGREKWLCAALGLILGGVIGNLYDRLVFGGVRDFLHVYRFGWPVFNVADCCLVVGAGLLIVQPAIERSVAPGRSPDPSCPVPTPRIEPAAPAGNHPRAPALAAADHRPEGVR
jgi:lipoprotein signal peptidase